MYKDNACNKRVETLKQAALPPETLKTFKTLFEFMKKVYVAPQSEIVKLIGKEHTMQMDLGFGTQTGSGNTYNEMY